MLLTGDTVRRRGTELATTSADRLRTSSQLSLVPLLLLVASPAVQGKCSVTYSGPWKWRWAPFAFRTDHGSIRLANPPVLVLDDSALGYVYAILSNRTQDRPVAQMNTMTMMIIQLALSLLVTLTFDLCPWNAFQKFSITWWTFVASFITIHPCIKIAFLRKQVLTNGQRTNDRMDDSKA